MHRITTTAIKSNHSVLIASPFEDYCRSDGKGSFISDGYEVYVSRFGLCAETAGAWLEETICVNECSTELFVGCVDGQLNNKLKRTCLVYQRKMNQYDELLKYRLFSPNDSTLRTDNTNVK